MARTTVHGHQVAYLDDGNSDPVLLLHSGASSSRQWRALCAALNQSWHILAPDFFGCGESDQWSGCSFDIDHDVDLAAAVAALGTRPVHLVGHSYGGRIALDLARRDKRQVRSLALYEPNPFWLLAEAGLPNRLQEIERLIDSYCATFDGGDPGRAMGDFIDYWNGPGSWAGLSDRARTSLMAAAETVRRQSPHTLIGTFSLSDLGQLDLPALILCGADTSQVTAPLAEIVAGYLPNARLATLPALRHMGPVEQPGIVNPAFIDWLASV